MFTGIVEGVGRVAGVEEGDGVRRIHIEADAALLADVSPGSSVAVDGACLTPMSVGGAGFLVEAIGTTVARTLAGIYVPGSRVNLERAMALGERLDGHLVQGHVDGLGFLKEIREVGEFRVLEFLVPPEVHRTTLLHGSIALNGVSLTVNRLLDDDGVEVGIIPHTWENTNFRWLKAGDAVNVEGDLIGKYVGKLLRSGLRGEETKGGPTDAV